MALAGRFFTFEGGEGSGKSTQAKMLAEFFQQQGRVVTLTREPGGEALGQKLRAILLSPETKNLSPMAELFLYMADRAQHVAEVIRPALDRGEIVICDRYMDSTVAYQGGGRGHNMETLDILNDMSTAGLYPNMTFLLDVPVEVGLARACARNGKDGDKEGRFEAEAVAFHERVWETYRDIAIVKWRFITIDAIQDVGMIHAEIVKRVGAYLK